MLRPMHQQGSRYPKIGLKGANSLSGGSPPSPCGKVSGSFDRDRVAYWLGIRSTNIQRVVERNSRGCLAAVETAMVTVRRWLGREDSNSDPCLRWAVVSYF